jgi:uncharacterized repeat protein (TIGR03803 family)
MTPIDNFLYGTTFNGGSGGVGTVFSFDPATGKETVVYSFQKNGTDGMEPVTDLIQWKGVLYGSTSKGGTYDYGTVFAFNPKTGAETVLYSNGYGINDPYENNRLLQMNGTLYGTVPETGDYDDGAIFSLTQ